MQLMISLLIFFMIASAVMAAFYLVTRRDLYLERLKLVAEDNEEIVEKPQSRFILSAKHSAENIAGVFATTALRENVQKQLISAGIPLRSEEYITICLGIIVVLPLLLYLFSKNVLLSIMVVLLSSFFPKAYLSLKKEQRIQTLNQQLADALIIMANALRAGFGFQQAMDTVRTELPPPIAYEFALTLREMNLGFGQEEALLNLSQRVNSEDLDMVVTGIIIQRQVGGNLAEILENIAATMRERTRIKREIKVLTAQGRLSGLIIGILPLFLVGAMLVINPAYFNVMITDMRGMTMLGIGIALQVIGFIAIKKIINIEY